MEDPALNRLMVYDAAWSTLGGGERYMYTLADVVSHHTDYEVTILLDTPAVDATRLRERFGLPAARVSFQTVHSANVRQTLRHSDIAVILSNMRPYGLPAPRTIYALQIPYAPITPLSVIQRSLTGKPYEAAKDIGRLLLLRDARRATGVLVNSRFVSDMLRRNHAIHGHLLYPPIEDFSGGGEKKKLILSVGRFFTGLYNDKRYDVLINAFKSLSSRPAAAGWRYVLAGSCGDDRASLQHLAHLKASAQGFNIDFAVNISQDELKSLYSQATLFWHAAGYGVNEDLTPDRTEHFGMTTVEAMSASCVPVVINRGGQKEIVSHNESGYLWETIDQLVDITADLMLHPDRIIPLQQIARARFWDFDRAHFTASLLSFFHQLEQKHQ